MTYDSYDVIYPNILTTLSSLVPTLYWLEVTERLFTTGFCARVTMKTIKQDESISRSRFIDCPVCKNHTLKLKRTVQVGRCKSCSETYKIIIVYVKDAKRVKTPSVTSGTGTGAKPETSPETALPELQAPSDSVLFGSSSE